MAITRKILWIAFIKEGELSEPLGDETGKRQEAERTLASGAHLHGSGLEKQR